MLNLVLFRRNNNNGIVKILCSKPYYEESRLPDDLDPMRTQVHDDAIGLINTISIFNLKTHIYALIVHLRIFSIIDSSASNEHGFEFQRLKDAGHLDIFFSYICATLESI